MTAPAQIPNQNYRSEDEINQASLNEQAGLILYYNEIKQAHETGKVQDVEGNPIPRQQHHYSNFATIRSSKPIEVDSGHLSLTKFISKPKPVMDLLQLIGHLNRTSKQASIDLMDFCIPKINFYKVFGKNDLIFKVPFGQLTDEQRKLYKSNHPNIDMSLNEGVYLTSFKADFKGGNPAEINSNIEAEATIFFTDAALLTDEIVAETGLINTNKESKEKRFSWIDIIAPGGNPNASASDYKIKVEIGYTYDEHAANTIYSETLPATRQAIKAGVERLNTILYLIPVSHNIKFDRETVEFTIQYQAAISQDMKKLDVFLASQAKSTILTKIANIEDKVNASEQAKKKVNEQIASEKSKKDKTEVIDKKTSDELENLKRELEIAKNQSYSSILRQIVGLEPRQYSKQDRKTGIYNLVVDPATLGLNLKGAVPEQKEGEQSNATPFYALERKIDADCHWSVGNLYIKSDSLLNAQGNGEGEGIFGGGQRTFLRNAGLNVQNRQSEEESKEVAAKLSFNNPTGRDFTRFAKINKPPNQKYLLTYMFLGDILDVACTCVRAIGTSETRPRLIFGNIKVAFPAPGVDPRNNNNSCATNNEVKVEYMNIADIPISYNLFQSFYINKLIKDRPSEIRLEFFVNSIINELLIPALGPSYFGNEAGFSNNQIKISTANINIPYTINGNDVFTGESKNNPFNGIIDLEAFKNKLDTLNFSSDISKGSGDYIIFYDSTPPKKMLQEAAKADSSQRKNINYNNGIIHITAPPFGRSGLVGLEFNRSDIEGAREAAVLNNGENGSRILSLKQAYEINATYEPGLPTYRPGDIVYVEPYYGGDGAVSDLSRQLGVEGYYNILSMNLQYNFTTIKTTLKGTLIGITDERKEKC